MHIDLTIPTAVGVDNKLPKIRLTTNHRGDILVVRVQDSGGESTLAEIPPSQRQAAADFIIHAK
jgi:hypothetical protein